MNIDILSKIIDCVKFCGAFELALWGHDENASSNNAGIFLGLVDFVAILDCVFEVHLKIATVFKGTTKTVQNVLDCMGSVLRNCILEDVKRADYLAIQADETTYTATHCQLVLVLRYIDSLKTKSDNTVATAVLKRLKTILPVLWRSCHDERSHRWPAVQGSRRLRDCPLRTLLWSSAEPDNTAGNIPHHQGRRFPLRSWIYCIFLQVIRSEPLF